MMYGFVNQRCEAVIRIAVMPTTLSKWLKLPIEAIEGGTVTIEALSSERSVQ